MRAIWAVYSLTKVLVYMNKTLSGRLREFRNKGQVQLSNPKSGYGRLREESPKGSFCSFQNLFGLVWTGSSGAKYMQY